MNKPRKIELISDGEGVVLVFVNGQPDRSYYCEYRLSQELENLLENLLLKYPNTESEDSA